LGRLYITQFIDTLQPAYASDLMVTGQGAILSIASFQNIRVFSISGLGVYAQDATLVASGTVDSGLSGFGMPDPKTAVQLHIDTTTLVGSYSVYLADDTGAFTLLGTQTSPDTSNSFPANNASSERFEVRVVLTRATTTTGPTFLRWTLKVLPTTADGPAELFHIPLMLYPEITTHGHTFPVDVEFERAAISDLRSTRQVIQYQEFNTTYTGIIVDFKWYPYGLVDAKDTGEYAAKGTLLCDFQRIA
jgi:hypothetical protein